jgi:putative ABC transport system substrate-binding protein
MKRRDLLALAAVAALTPKALLAQRSFRIATLDDALEGIRASAWAALRRRLTEAGFASIGYESRYARGDTRRLPALAQELARHKPDIMISAGTPATQAAMKATNTIPIVFAGAGNPVETGLVASLERPGGNVTGTSLPSAQILERSFELLRELTPNAKTYAYIADPSNTASALSFASLQKQAEMFKRSVRMLDGHDAKALEKTFAAIRGDKTEGLLVGIAAALLEQRDRIVQFAERERLPAVYGRREYVDAGGLIACGGDMQALYLRSAEYVEKILKGAKPAALPVEQVSGTRIVLNMKAAHALDLALPARVRTRADELIE